MPKTDVQPALFDLGFAGVTATGLDIRDREPSWEDLEHAYLQLTVSEQASQWSLGDWWILADGVYGEKAPQLVVNARCSRKTLQNYAWVCRKFVRFPVALPSHGDWPLRRRLVLSFYHHSAVAGLVGESDQATALAVRLLDEAEADPERSVEDLEEAVRQFRGEPEDKDEGEEVGFAVGPVPQRLDRLYTSISNLQDDLPDDWNAERVLLGDALTALDACRNSARNREIGGAPALVGQPQEVEA
ncbi:MAG: hypothetical protein MUP86_02170 [Dehalococcoidia bacterium]|nr:hypothetical protein [Dehalococcoidia bacterium]